MGQLEEVKKEDDDRAKYIVGHPKRLSHRARFRIALKKLREEFPTRHPVKLRKIKGSNYHGYAYLHTPRSKDIKPYFVIVINSSSRVSYHQQFDTLIHEWAHIYTWYDLKDGETDHGPTWTKAYGKIYRIMVED